MKRIFLFLLICSTSFGAGYSYKVTEFKKIRNLDTGNIDAIYITIEASNGVITATGSQSISQEDIAAYVADSTYEKTIAERSSALAKSQLDLKIRTSNLSVEKYAKSSLDAIVIDPAKVDVATVSAVAVDVIK